MTYVVCNEGRNGWGDIILKEFDNKEDAVAQAKEEWKGLSEEDREKRHIYVLESVNPDPESEDHLDGAYVWKCDEE